MAQMTVSKSPEAADSSHLPMPSGLHRWGRIIVLALLTLLPAVYSPWFILYNGVDSPRRLFLLLGSGLLLACIVLAWAHRRQFILRWHTAIDRPAALFLAAALFTGLTTFAGSFFFSTFGPVWSQESVWILLSGYLLYLGVKEFLRTPEERNLAVLGMVGMGGLLALLGLIDHFHPLPLSKAFSGHRLVSTMGNSMFAGTYFAMLIPLGVGAGLGARGGRRVLHFACTALMVFALFFTLARAAWLGLALALIILAFIAVSRLYTFGKQVLIPIVVSILLLAVGAGILTAVRPEVRTRLNNVIRLNDLTAKTRMVYMRGALNAFLGQPETGEQHDHNEEDKRLLRPAPLIGWGTGNIRHVYPEYRPPSTLLEMGIPINRGYSSALPHNYPLQIAAEMGIIGLIPFIWLIIALYRGGLRLLRDQPEQRLLAIGLIGLLSAWLFTNLASFDNSATLGLFWGALGLLAGMGAADTALGDKGRRAAPRFKPGLARFVNGLGVVTAIVVILSFALQTGAAFCAQRSVDAADEAFSLHARISTGEVAPDQALGTVKMQADAATQYALLTKRLSIVPEMTTGRLLFRAYQLEALLAGNESRALEIIDDKLVPAANASLRWFPRDPVLLRMVSMMMMQMGRPQETRHYLEYLDYIEPHSAEVKLMVADLFEIAGDYEAAKKHIFAAQKLDPENPQIYANMGHVIFISIDPETDNLAEYLNAVYDCFQDAEKYGFDFTMNEQMLPEYALAEFSHGDVDAAALRAAKISHPGIVRQFEQILYQFADKLGRREDADRVIQKASTAWKMRNARERGGDAGVLSGSPASPKP